MFGCVYKPCSLFRALDCFGHPDFGAFACYRGGTCFLGTSQLLDMMFSRIGFPQSAAFTRNLVVHYSKFVILFVFEKSQTKPMCAVNSYASLTSIRPWSTRGGAKPDTDRRDAENVQLDIPECDTNEIPQGTIG